MFKKLFILCIPFLIVSCAENPFKNAVKSIITKVTEKQPEDTFADTIVDGVYLSECMKIYSKSYDGFINIRESTTTKSRQIGQFRNGPEPAYVLSREGKWFKIFYRGLKGYVHEAFISYTPTKDVTINIDGDWLEGIYGNDGYSAYLIFNNGTYAYESQYGTICIGRYMLEGNEIVLTPIVHLQSDLPADKERFEIDVTRRTIGGMERGSFYSSADFYEEYRDYCMITKEDFQYRKKHYKTLLPK